MRYLRHKVVARNSAKAELAEDGDKVPKDKGVPDPMLHISPNE